MKKILLLTGMLLATVVTNGASVTWTATAASTTLPDGSVANGVIAYLFEGTLSKDVLVKISSGLWDASTSGYKATKTTNTNGALALAKIGSYEKQTVSFSMIIFDSSTYSEASSFKYAEVKDVEFTTANKTVAFGNALTETSWQSIPEPTSGLLMLLGVAGLALRRKHL